MSDDKTRKVPPRWKKGGQRYGREDVKALTKIRPVDGWRNGAKVSKK